MKKYFILGTFAFISLFVIARVDGQKRDWSWERIVPLVSRCDDVKNLFSLTKCDFPVTRVVSPSREVVIEFSTPSDSWEVSNDTVVNVLILFRDLPRLFDFTTEFTDYKIKHEGDVPEILIYRNDKKGIELTVHTATGLYIGSVLLLPSEANSRKLKRSSRLKKP